MALGRADMDRETRLPTLLHSDLVKESAAQEVPLLHVLAPRGFPHVRRMEGARDRLFVHTSRFPSLARIISRVDIPAKSMLHIGSWLAGHGSKVCVCVCSPLVL